MLKITTITKYVLTLNIFLLITSIQAQVGIGTLTPTAQLTVEEDAIFNESGGANDFRIESDGFEHMFYMDATNNRFGINVDIPLYTWHFKTTNVNKWLSYWENDNPTLGAMSQFYHSNSNNGNRVGMAITNYSGSTYEATAYLGVSLHTTIFGSGGIGVKGAANNERGNGVEGSLNFQGSYDGWAGYFSADLYCNGNFSGSDRRLKRDVESISNAISVINQLNPVSYFYDTDTYPNIGFDENRKSYGFIAQELEGIFPEMVKEKLLVLNANEPYKDGINRERETDTFKVVNYTLLIPVLTQAVKEQQEVIDNQNSRIDNLEQRLINMENRLNNFIENQD